MYEEFEDDYEEFFLDDEDQDGFADEDIDEWEEEYQEYWQDDEFYDEDRPW